MALSGYSRLALDAALANRSASEEIGNILNVAQALSSTEAGFIDGVTAGTAAASKAVVLDGSKGIATITSATITAIVSGGITGNDSSLGVTGLAATSATGGAVAIAGGATTTSGVGGAVTVTGGAASGTSAGGAVSLTGGASGSGATGNGGAASVTGGAAASTNGSGGAASLVGGVATGTGTGGAITITSGASAGAGGTAGSITIDTGAAAGGTEGGITIGSAATKKVGFFGANPVVQAANIVAPSGGAVQDAECRTAVASLLTAVKNLGFVATS